MLNNVNGQSPTPPPPPPPLLSGLFSSHLRGKNAGDFHILTAICSFLREAPRVFLTHRKHIEIDCVCFCVCPCMCVRLPEISFWMIFCTSTRSLYLIRLLFNRILPLSCTSALCCHYDDLRVLQEEENSLLFCSQGKHIQYVMWVAVYHRRVIQFLQSVEECVVIGPRLRFGPDKVTCLNHGFCSPATVRNLQIFNLNDIKHWK